MLIGYDNLVGMLPLSPGFQCRYINYIYERKGQRKLQNLVGQLGRKLWLFFKETTHGLENIGC